MKLILSKEEADDLVKKCVLIPIKDKVFKMQIPYPDKNKKVYVYTEVHTEEQEVSVSTLIKDEEKEEANNNKSEKSLKEWFEEFREQFPTSDAHGTWVKTRPSMRSDRGRKAFGRFKDLVNKEDLYPEDIIAAMKYDVWVRKSGSKVAGKNLMKFMPGLQPWLNDPGYIKGLIESMQSDEVYKAATNDQKGNKIKLY